MTRLVRLYASNLLKTETITAAEDDLTSLNFTRNKALDDEDLGIGNDAWAVFRRRDGHETLLKSCWRFLYCY